MPARRFVSIVAFSTVVMQLTAVQADTEAPLLVLRPDEVVQIRATLAGDAKIPTAEVEAARSDLRSLRAYFGSDLGAERLPGELLGSAFLHLVDSRHPDDRVRLARIERAMSEPWESLDDPLELALAANWARRDLKPEAVSVFLGDARPSLAALDATDSPSRPREFRVRLFSLALALSFDERASEDAGWPAVRTEILEKAKRYFADAFPNYVALRGPTPTAPVFGAQEEADVFIAIELADALLGGRYWPQMMDSVRLWLTHHLITSDGQEFGLPILRDRVGVAELGLSPQWRDLVPLRAHLLARRTNDATAGAVARSIDAKLRNERSPILARPWRWVSLAFPVRGLAAVDRDRPPLALNLSNAVAFQAGRSGMRAWIEVGSPYLRPGQHFDAGHFLLLLRNGYVTSSGGADIELEASPLKGGEQRLGASVEPFPFEQYRISTIAHNCLLLWDDTYVEKWNGELFLPVGGQRVESGVASNFAPLSTRQTDPRVRGKLVAFGIDREAAYCAMDLTNAYPRRNGTRYTREFVFCPPNRLLVIDRARPDRPSSIPIFILNLPSAPMVDGEAVGGHADGGRSAGGVWTFDKALSITWKSGTADCRMEAILPAERKLTVAGGPALAESIPEGEYRGWEYVPGSAESFERLITPASRHGAKNAWYRLGKPTALGPAFEAAPHWGRLEVEAAERQTEVVFVNLMTIDANSSEPAQTIESPQGWSISWGTSDVRTTVTVPRVGLGGRIEFGKGQGWRFPEEVEPNPVWPLESR